MKNQVDYFEKIIKLLKELRKDHPDVELSKHYCLATDSGSFSMSDKELYQALQKYKTELDMNTLSNRDLEKVIDDAEDMFKEIDVDPWEIDEEEEF